jgi:CRP/FNR family transcriptional regulator, anaerobic regulatory protein
MSSRPLRNRLRIVDTVRLVEGPCAACGVRDSSFCACLDAAGLEELRGILTRVRVPAGRLIAEEGAPREHVANVTRGVVRTYKSLADGRRQVTGFLLPGDFLGLAGEGVHADSAEAVVEVELCRYPAAAFAAFLDAHPQAARRLFGQARRDLAAAQDHLLQLGRKSAKARLAWLLLDLARRSHGEPTPGMRVDLPMSRHDIADHLGLTVETVSRNFTRLRKAGVIDLDDSQAPVLRDPEALARLADDD